MSYEYKGDEYKLLERHQRFVAFMCEQVLHCHPFFHDGDMRMLDTAIQIHDGRARSLGEPTLGELA